jgi:tetratricopeptide (TPR) repeat protein
MEHSFISRAKMVRMFAAILTAGCLLEAASGQTGAANKTAAQAPIGSGAAKPMGADDRSESILQRRYEAAQRFQSAGDLVHSAEQYRIFLADALGEIAIGNSAAGRYEKAQDNFDEALRLVPDFPMMQLASARAALKAGRAEHASVLARALLQRYPTNTKIQTDAHVLLGRALVKMDKNAEAKQQFESALYLDPTFDNGYELAVADLNLGDAVGAHKVFAEMLSSFGDTAALHMYFGQAYGNSDFQSDAVAELEKAVEEDPKLPGVHYSLAVAYLATAGDSKLAQAEEELRKEIAISPKDAAAYAALGHLLATHGQGQEDQSQAEANLKRATELDPTNPDGFLYLGQFYADQKHVAEAQTALRKSIALTTDVSRNSFQVQKAHYLLARLLMQDGDKTGADAELAASKALMQQNLSRDQNQLSQYLNETKRSGMGAEFTQPMKRIDEGQGSETKSTSAVDAFERRVTPAIADSYNNLGAIAGSGRNYAEALVDFQRAAEWQPSLPGLDFNWGRAAFSAGAYTEAIGPLGRFLQAHPEDNDARRILGLSQFMAKNYSTAKGTLEPLVNRPGEAQQVQFAYADSLLKTGEIEAAMSRLEALDKATPTLPEVRPALSEAYALIGRRQLEKGDEKGAIVNLQNAVRLDPDNAALRQTLQQASGKQAGSGPTPN